MIIKKENLIVKNIGQLCTLKGAVEKQGRRISSGDLGLIKNAAMIITDGKVQWVGDTKKIPKNTKARTKSFKTIDAQGGVVLPGFVDSHTHLVFAGDRSGDFESRLQGKSYSQIAKEGGGILRTMQATRKASTKALFERAMTYLKIAASQGITTLEIKTGYGLDFKSEKKCLDVIAKLKKSTPQKIMATCLAAHAVPPEFKNRPDEYIQTISKVWLKKLKRKIDFVDAFVDEGFFSSLQGQKLAAEASRLGLRVKLHADEIALSGGTRLAIACEALSADHLLKIQDAEIQALAKSEVTATLLPATAFFLREGYAPAKKLLDAGARVALATDFNPGTAPSQDLALVALLAALEMKMTVEQILVALTLNGAYALGLESSKGALVPGFDGDFVLYESENLADFMYRFGLRWIGSRTFARGYDMSAFVKKS